MRTVSMNLIPHINGLTDDKLAINWPNIFVMTKWYDRKAVVDSLFDCDDNIIQIIHYKVTKDFNFKDLFDTLRSDEDYLKETNKFKLVHLNIDNLYGMDTKIFSKDIVGLFTNTTSFDLNVVFIITVGLVRTNKNIPHKYKFLSGETIINTPRVIMYMSQYIYRFDEKGIRCIKSRTAEVAGEWQN